MPRPKKSSPNRADGRYEVKLTIGKTLDGKLIRKSFYSEISKDDARKQADAYNVERKAAQLSGITFIESSTKFDEWARKWLEVYKKGKVKDNTYNGTYEAPTLNHLLPHFGASDLDNIKPVDVQAFFDQKGKTCSLESMRKMKSCLWSIFDTAIENDLCRRNPVTRNVKLESKVETPDKQTYTQAQYDIVHTFAKSHPDGLSLLIMLETGISRSELLGLRWIDFDADNKVLHIRQGLVEQRNSETGKYETVSDGLKNAHRERDIPISGDLARRIKETPAVIYIGGNKKKGVDPRPVITANIIYSPQGTPYTPHNWQKRVYQKVMEDMQAKYKDIPMLSPHELRHTRATLWKDAGVDLFTLARLLGHADLDMLAKRYAHDNIDVVRAALGL